MTNGWDGTPPAGVDHVVVVTHRGGPEGWYPEAPFYFVDGIDIDLRPFAGSRGEV